MIDFAGGSHNLIFTIPMAYCAHAIGPIILKDSSRKRDQKCLLDPRNTWFDKEIWDQYKLKVQSIETGFIETFYTSDFLSLINEGTIKVELRPAFYIPLSHDELDALKYAIFHP